MKISQYFSLAEFVDSQYAIRNGIDNTPADMTVELAIINTAARLDAVRALLDRPVIISSGYRCPALNKAIGGSKTSGHMTGEAVDFTAPLFGPPGEVFRRLKNSSIKFDQLILEMDRWVHLGFGAQQRGQILIYNGCTYREIQK